MITIKRGDLLSATEKIIGHQVNCYGIAGGLAAAVFDKYPYVWNDYDQWVRIANIGGSAWSPLGAAQLTGEQSDGHIICNLYGQKLPGADYRPKALEAALTMLGNCARKLNASVALPWKISCGICGGDWNEVYQIIERTMEGVDCVIYQREGD